MSRLDEQQRILRRLVNEMSFDGHFEWISFSDLKRSWRHECKADLAEVLDVLAAQDRAEIFGQDGDLISLEII